MTTGIPKEQLAIGTAAAFAQAEKSFKEGGVPIGSALLVGTTVVALGHNQRVQKSSNILHGEMSCIENAGHHVDFTKAVLFSTLSPCKMCAGAIVLFRIPKVVILDDENTNDFDPGQAFLVREGVDVVVHKHPPSIDLNRQFQSKFRTIWLGDVGQ